MNNDTNRAVGVLDRIATEQGDDAAIDAAASNFAGTVAWLAERVGPTKTRDILLSAAAALFR